MQEENKMKLNFLVKPVRPPRIIIVAFITLESGQEGGRKSREDTGPSVSRAAALRWMMMDFPLVEPAQASTISNPGRLKDAGLLESPPPDSPPLRT